MNPHTWLLFVLTVAVVSAIPGPNMLLMVSHGARHGWRRTMATMAGCLSALVLMMSVSAAGLGLFLRAWPALFDTLRLGGAAYLAWLGYRTWRGAAHAHGWHEQGADATAPAPRARTLARNGFLVASSNPKAILFAAALLPQFIDPHAPGIPQFAVLVSTFAVIEVTWYFVYAGFGARLAPMLHSARVARAFHRTTGGIFIGFGAAMAALR